MTHTLDEHIITQQATLFEALRRLNALPGRAMTLFVVDPDGRMIGTLTDGDVRRAILAGQTLDSTVEHAMYRDFRALADGDDARDTVRRLRRYRDRDITLLPRIDATGRPVDIIDLRVTRSLLPVSAILMAGGKGERLRPMTLTTPKPLLRVEGKAIIDYNIEALAACGISDITVCTRYLAEQIHDHFSHPVAGVSVRCVTEDRPLGTIGAATLVTRQDPDGDTLVMNSDLLTTIDFDEMYLRHTDQNADITIAVIPYQVSVPYALLTTDGDTVTGIEEKPSASHFANAGIYMVKNRLLDNLPRDERIDATDFIADAIAGGYRVVYYAINGTWIDVGSPADFRQAVELMRHHRNFRPAPRG